MAKRTRAKRTRELPTHGPPPLAEDDSVTAIVRRHNEEIQRQLEEAQRLFERKTALLLGFAKLVDRFVASQKDPLDRANAEWICGSVLAYLSTKTYVDNDGASYVPLHLRSDPTSGTSGEKSSPHNHQLPNGTTQERENRASQHQAAPEAMRLSSKIESDGHMPSPVYTTFPCVLSEAVNFNSEQYPILWTRSNP